MGVVQLYSALEEIVSAFEETVPPLVFEETVPVL